MKKRSLGILVFCLLLFGLCGTAFAAEKTKSPYYITVNLTANVVTVYEKDAAGNYTVPIKAFRCSGGTDTPEGTFRTSAKYEWRALYGNVWGQYATRITGPYLFHSVPYFEKDKTTLEYDEFNKLGTTASAGCIRLTVRDVKWIYDNCPIGITVRMYRGEVKEPLQPAAVPKVNRNDTVRRGWDPTDPAAANPWRKGTMQEMQLQTAETDDRIELYYEKGAYYISASNAKQLFAFLDREIGLSADGNQVKYDAVKVSYDGETKEIEGRAKGDAAYYKLRDLTNLIGAEMHWDKDTKHITIRLDEKEILLGKDLPERVPEIKDEATFPEKLAAFFMMQN
ncbi:L,D-transpeptidase [Clostridium sp. MCC345]|uniref:L,D-transpeptidase n=1 Tax=Clostridium sp. MCC345 TaxID=2592645 RepID=UPI001C02D90B|nr:L,D-transpeptidase family protein [Clostridium sp. MCC345]